MYLNKISSLPFYYVVVLNLSCKSNSIKLLSTCFSEKYFHPRSKFLWCVPLPYGTLVIITRRDIHHPSLYLRQWSWNLMSPVMLLPSDCLRFWKIPTVSLEYHSERRERVRRWSQGVPTWVPVGDFLVFTE